MSAHPDDAGDDAAPDEVSPAEAAGLRRGGVVAGVVGVVALVAALLLYLAGGRPYGVDVGAGVLYLLGLLAALIASVLLWMTWAHPPMRASARRPAGAATAAGALLLTGACVVVSLGRAGGAALQLTLMGATAVVLAAAVGTLALGARRS